MKKKTLVILLCSAMLTSFASGCGAKNETEATATLEGNSTEASVEETVDDQAAADEVAALIDAIYVQTRTEQTDAQCVAAKAAWDALTDEQKKLVQGTFADPDYFGKDTGDVTLDNALNQDEIGENELLVVSFGTSFNDSRAVDIGGIETTLQKAYPDWSIRRAFTSQIIINHVQARDGEKIDNMEQALERSVANGVKHLVIQPTHLMHGAEYDELVEAVSKYQDKLETVKIAEPLLGEVGADATVMNEDKEIVSKAVVAEAIATAGLDSIESADKDGIALVLMGHGTSHTAKVTYTQMQAQMDSLGYNNVFIGTVEGEPEDTACEVIIEQCKEAGYEKVILRPLMVVAGDHANNDMAGEDEDSWMTQFETSGYFESVDAQIEGLGRIEAIEQLYVNHTASAIAETGITNTGNTDTVGTLEDGVYDAEFNTDSGMFHANEACDGKGVLKVKDGKMTFHVSLTSKNILNLYEGLAVDAERSKADLLNPTLDTVEYSDGTKEEVNGFDINVPAIGQDFDLALIGSKGKWYDHKVSISNPVKKETTDEKDGNYQVPVTLEGGSGKASIESPALVTVKDGKMTATIVWSSSNYDYMLVDGKKYLPVNKTGNSTFEIPIFDMNCTMEVIGDTIAMSTPHEVEYTLVFKK